MALPVCYSSHWCCFRVLLLMFNQEDEKKKEKKKKNYFWSFFTCFFKERFSSTIMLWGQTTAISAGRTMVICWWGHLPRKPILAFTASASNFLHWPLCAWILKKSLVSSFYMSLPLVMSHFNSCMSFFFFFCFLQCFLKTFNQRLITVHARWAHEWVKRWPKKFF